MFCRGWWWLLCDTNSIGSNASEDSTSSYTSDYWIIKFCDSTLTTSITQLPNTQLSFCIFPNPSSGIFQITFPSSSNQKPNYTLEVINTLGQTVFQTAFRTPNTGPQTNIDVSFLPKGMYVLKINDRGSAISSKFVIE